MPASRIVIALGMTMLLASRGTPRTRHTEPSGHEIYMARCASCHGEEGKGGPAETGKLTDARADLTALSRRNGGSFPAGRVRNILVGLVDVPAHHGPNPMPIWGGVFDAKTNPARRHARDQLEILTAYLESIQQH